MKNNLWRHIQEIDYIFKKLSRDYAVGHHPSALSGSGFIVREYQSIFDRPDFANIDWLASAFSGSRLPLVKVVEQKSAIAVTALVDISASMGFSGVARKKDEVCKLIAALGFSSYKIGDRFSLIAYGKGIAVYFEPRTSRTHFLSAAEWVDGYEPSDANGGGLMSAGDYLPARPGLVFWLSDFNFDLKIAERFLSENCETHDIIPIVFWDSAEFEKMPNWGLAWLRDPETGTVRPELFTPGRKREIKSAFEKRRLKLEEIFRQSGVDPIFVVDKLSIRKIEEYFLKRRL